MPVLAATISHDVVLGVLRFLFSMLSIIFCSFFSSFSCITHSSAPYVIVGRKVGSLWMRGALVAGHDYFSSRKFRQKDCRSFSV